MKFSVEFEGLEKLIHDLDVYIEAIEHMVGGALFQEGEELMADAKRLTPVDEGVLRASGFVKLPKMDGQDVFVDVGFGGPAGSGNHGGVTNSAGVGYAVIQHEDLTFHHTVGQAKFLEQPLNERMPGYSDRIARRLARSISAAF